MTEHWKDGRNLTEHVYLIDNTVMMIGTMLPNAYIL